MTDTCQKKVIDKDMKHPNKKYTIDEEEVCHAGEPAFNMQIQQTAIDTLADTTLGHDSRHNFMRDFVYSNYDQNTAQELEAKNFLIGAPFKYDKIETEDDWERIEQEAENSGYATDTEVQNVMQRWLNL